MFVKTPMEAIHAHVVMDIHLNKIIIAVKVWLLWHAMHNCMVSNIAINFTDINECADSNGICQHNCTNTIGSYYCTYNDDYTLDEDDHNCSG